MNDSEYNLLLDVAQERATFLENPRHRSLVGRFVILYNFTTKCYGFVIIGYR